jgi:signal transduction histidine kinase
MNSEQSVLRALDEERVARRHQEYLLASLEAIDRASLVVKDVLGSSDGAQMPLVLRSIVEQATTLTGAELGALSVGDQVTTLAEMPGMPAVLSAIGMNGLPVRIKDVRAHHVFNGFPASHPRISNVIAVAIPHDEMTAGTLFVANKQDGGEFTEHDERCLVLFARRISYVLQIVRLNEGRLRERERLQVLADTGRALPSSLDLLLTLRRVARLSIPRLADCCLMYLCDDDRLHFGGVAHRDPRSEQVLSAFHQRLPPEAIDGGTFAQIARSRHAVMVSRALPTEELAGIDSWIGVPIISRDQTWGVMLFGYAGSGRHYESMDLALVEEIAFRAALAVDNARLYQEATAALRAHDNLLAIVSHDLRNPLNNIFLNVGLLSRFAQPDRRRGRVQIDAIKQSAVRLNRLVEDLITASTIEAGHFTAETQPERVAALLDDVRETLEPQVVSRGLSLKIADTAGEVRVLCDRDRLLQVFENLFRNALGVTPKGGAITLDTSVDGDRVIFTVTDAGPGIAAADLPFVFDRYFKQEDSPTRSVGLALSIVKGIIETHGGKVWVRSELGGGASFFFTLPIAP